MAPRGVLKGVADKSQIRRRRATPTAFSNKRSCPGFYSVLSPMGCGVSTSTQVRSQSFSPSCQSPRVPPTTMVGHEAYLSELYGGAIISSVEVLTHTAFLLLCEHAAVHGVISDEISGSPLRTTRISSTLLLGRPGPGQKRMLFSRSETLDVKRWAPLPASLRA